MDDDAQVSSHSSTVPPGGYPLGQRRRAWSVLMGVQRFRLSQQPPGVDTDRQPARPDAALDEPRGGLGRRAAPRGEGLTLFRRVQRPLGAHELAAQVGHDSAQARQVRREFRHRSASVLRLPCGLARCAERVLWG
ncbi:hypothetical protein [Streptomyces sp. NPDC049949]|uniref:hypothetical protein n=1 Tax=Streptomyces sp. NPDC049949 TaxID=3154627 RepID=UPI00341B3025